MGVTHFFLSTPDGAEPVLDWFRGLAPAPALIGTKGGVWVYFRELGPLVPSDETFDTERSPLVGVFLPQVRRGILYTAGEVHFLPTPLREQFPALDRVNRKFKQWLASFPQVWSSSPGWPGEWNYYIEGSIKEFARSAFALPSGMQALAKGNYFIKHDEPPIVVEKVCNALRLRGVNCEPEA